MKQRRGSVKKITAMLLSLAMVATTIQLPAPARAEAASTTCTVGGCGGTYTNGFCSKVTTHYEAPELNAEGYYEIGNAGELYWFAAHVNAGNLTSNAVLTADIVVNEGTMTAESTGVREWVPICENPRAEGDTASNYPSNGYAGIFDGKGYSVSGLFFSNSTKNYVGFFGGLTKGTVKNVGIINSYIKANEEVGGIAGNCARGTIVDCYNDAIIIGKYHVGGIVGSSWVAVLKCCYNGGTVTASNYHAGGIVGASAGGKKYKIECCYNSGDVTGYEIVGGIVGESITSVYDCYNCGKVRGTGTSRIGGIVGRHASVNDGEYRNCYYVSNRASGYSEQPERGIDSDSGNNLDIEGGATPFDSLDILTSGEICYLLNNGVTDGTQAFYQTVGSGAPAFSGETVYYGYENCDATEKIYANTPLATEEIPHTYSNKCDSSCNVCGARRTTTHTYSYDCDSSCNVCGAIRSATHDLSCECGVICQSCGEGFPQCGLYEFELPECMIMKEEYSKSGSTLYIYPTCQVCGKRMTFYSLSLSLEKEYSGKEGIGSSTIAGVLKKPEYVFETDGGEAIDVGEYDLKILW